MATIYRAYGRDDRGAHRLYTHWLTAGLVALGVAAHAWFPLVPWLFTAYVMWSPWHYTGQNFGVLMMFLRRAGVDVSAEERRRLHLAFLASFVMLLAAFNTGASADPLVLSLGLPPISARIVEAGAGLTFLAGGLAAFVPLARRAPRRALLAPLTLYSTQALWFVLPVAVSWMASIDTPQTRYSSGMLAVMHSAQYLWITRYFAKRDAEQAARAGGWSPWRYWATLVAGGAALFLPIPWLASYGWHVDFTASIFIVAAIVNLHHFMIDGVVWKLRNPRVGRVLVQADATAANAVPAATRRRPRMPRRHGVRRSGGPGGRRSSPALAAPRRGRSVALRPGHRPRRARPAGGCGAPQPVRQRHLPAPGPGRERGRRSGGRRGRAAARRRRQPAEPGPRAGAGAPADRSRTVRRGLPRQ